MPNTEKGLLTPKTTTQSIGVGTIIAAVVATLAFAIPGGPARAEYQILSDAQLDQVCGAFKVTRSNGFGQISGDTLFNAHEILSIGSNFFQEDAASSLFGEGNADSKYWQYFPTGGQIGNGKLTIPPDTLVRIYPVANTSVNPDPNNPGVFTYLSDPNNVFGTRGFFDPPPNIIYYMEQSTTHYTTFDTNLERITHRQ